MIKAAGNTALHFSRGPVSSERNTDESLLGLSFDYEIAAIPVWQTNVA